MSLAFDRNPAEALSAQGLTSAEVADRLRHDGRNESPQERKRGAFRIIMEAVREPMLAASASRRSDQSLSTVP